MLVEALVKLYSRHVDVLIRTSICSKKVYLRCIGLVDVPPPAKFRAVIGPAGAICTLDAGSASTFEGSEGIFFWQTFLTVLHTGP